uniref:Uncharacterized protein n=1 Tax=Glossina austeni TaxID=7395 RepID=A0A1A9UET0_GLOAU
MRKYSEKRLNSKSYIISCSSCVGFSCLTELFRISSLFCLRNSPSAIIFFSSSLSALRGLISADPELLAFRLAIKNPACDIPCNSFPFTTCIHTSTSNDYEHDRSPKSGMDFVLLFANSDYIYLIFHQNSWG